MTRKITITGKLDDFDRLTKALQMTEEMICALSVSKETNQLVLTKSVPNTVFFPAELMAAPILVALIKDKTLSYPDKPDYDGSIYLGWKMNYWEYGPLTISPYWIIYGK